MTNPKLCARCYRALPDGAGFCPNCGTATGGSAEQPPAPPVGRHECPSCHELNAPDATFCRACGTQMSRPGDHGGTRPEPSAAGAPGQDPWATGPGYSRPLDPDSFCPRCKSHRQRHETSCVNCGMPFAAPRTYIGVSVTVAREGDPAGFWIRFLAVIIDGIIVFAIGAFAWPIVFGEAFWYEPTPGFYTTRDWHTLMLLLWDVFFVALYGATPGKMVLGIRVLNERGSRRIGFLRATVRALAEYVSALTLGIGYLMAAFRKDKRALHDLIAGTYPTKVN